VLHQPRTGCFAKLIAAHARSGADMTVACLEISVEEARAFGVRGVDADSRITRFAEKPAVPDAIPGRPDIALVSMGIYVFNAPFLYEQLNRDAANRASSHDFGKDLIPILWRDSVYSRIISRIAASGRRPALRIGATSARLTPIGRPIWN
jgi:ADP-glucose pyrophosphorylase